jgi:predicted Zn-dependent protease
MGVAIMRPKLHFCIFLTALLFLFCFLGCTTNPVTGEEQLALFYPSEAQQIQIGTQYAPEIEKQLGGRIESAQLQNYVNYVGQRIANRSHKPNLTFHFTAVNDKMTNAMALPGGYIFITRGMLELLETEDQLAAVLAHESAHVTAEHSAQLMNQQMSISAVISVISSESTPNAAISAAQFGQQMLGLKYSRDFEKQADRIGTDYLARANYSPYAMIDVLSKLEEQSKTRQIEFFSTHPSPENRLALIEQHIHTNGYAGTPRTSGESYKKKVLDILK